MNNFGIRNVKTGNIIQTFDNPILAREEIKRKKANEDLEKKTKTSTEYEVVVRTVNNIYKQFPDGQIYIVGVESKWNPYESEVENDK